MQRLRVGVAKASALLDDAAEIAHFHHAMPL
jgi:hypothetical protein